jgi:NAD(P)-dependent dehydrogenase (short-subunit alcohol dehydrogenase family)
MRHDVVKPFDFRDATAFVIGGARGLGLALAGGLVEHGARVAISSRNPEALEDVRADLAERHGTNGNYILDCTGAEMSEENGQAGIEVTPEMVRAGEARLADAWEVGSAYAAEEVYLAMEAVRAAQCDAKVASRK